MKKIIKDFLPPIFLKAIKSVILSKYGFFGDYTSWQEAKKDCTGYDDAKIFEKVKTAILRVKSGEAVYERDSVLFDKIQYSWSALACLMYVAARNGGVLSVLDFGGSLGSSYFQNRKFFDGLDVKWSVVEQPHFVEFGKKEMEDSNLKFYYTIEECLKERSSNVVLLSSVLQYLEKPYLMLEKITGFKIPFILIDRTPFSKNNHESIKIQKVPPYIYEANYPCWFFAETVVIKKMMGSGYNLLEVFISEIDNEINGAIFKGLFFQNS